MTRFLASSPAFFGGLVIFTLTLGLQGCEEVTSPLGQELIKEEEKYQVLTDTISVIETFITDTSRFKSSNNKQVYLSHLQNEFWGTTKASFASKLSIRSVKPDVKVDTIVFHKNAVVDSAQLHLAFDPYGPVANQQIQVYKLVTPLEDSLYSDFDMKSHYFPIEVSEETTIRVDSTIKIDLKEEFAQFLFDGEEYLTSSDSLEENLLPGIYCQITEPANNAGIFGINLSESVGKNEIRLFYHVPDDNKDTTYQYNFWLSSINSLYTVKNNYEGSAIAEAKNNPESEVDDPFYIQGLGGVKSKIEIQGLDRYTADSNYAILKAELQVPIVNNYIKEIYSPINQLYLYTQEEDGRKVHIRDYTDGSTIFGGQPDDDNTHYTFNITRHITDILNQKEENKTLYFTPPFEQNPGRVMLSGGETKLIITYTKQ